MPDDLTKKDPEWFLSGACGALHRLPPGHWRDTALDKLDQARSALSLARAEGRGEWSLPRPRGASRQPDARR